MEEEEGTTTQAFVMSLQVYNGNVRKAKISTHRLPNTILTIFFFFTLYQMNTVERN